MKWTRQNYVIVMQYISINVRSVVMLNRQPDFKLINNVWFKRYIYRVVTIVCVLQEMTDGLERVLFCHFKIRNTVETHFTVLWWNVQSGIFTPNQSRISTSFLWFTVNCLNVQCSSVMYRFYLTMSYCTLFYCIVFGSYALLCFTERCFAVLCFCVTLCSYTMFYCTNLFYFSMFAAQCYFVQLSMCY